MITLKASNKDLVRGAADSFLLTHYASGVTALELLSGSGFAADDYVLLGEFGQENAEIVQIDTITGSAVTLKAATKFAHAESTRATILPFNQILFYHTTGTTFNTDTPLGSLTNIQADSLYCTYEDSVNSTGYGWFAFYNATTLEYSTYSNYIPYTDFAENTAQKIVERFLRSLNQEESKIISFDDAFAWLSEGYSIATAELFLVNGEYKASDSYTLSSVIGTAEYALPSTFSELISVWNDTTEEYVEAISVNKIDEVNHSLGSLTRYYLRGNQIGFAPVPTKVEDFIIRYTIKGATITSPTDTIDLPDNNYNILSDYLRFRAATPLERNDGADYFTLFTKGIERMKGTAIDRDGGADSWTPGYGTNV